MPSSIETIQIIPGAFIPITGVVLEEEVVAVVGQGTLLDWSIRTGQKVFVLKDGDAKPL